MIKAIIYLVLLLIQQCAHSELKFTTTNTALVELLSQKKHIEINTGNSEVCSKEAKIR